MKREELIKAICGKMQNWYRIGSGEEAVVKYVLSPVSVAFPAHFVFISCFALAD